MADSTLPYSSLYPLSMSVGSGSSRKSPIQDNQHAQQFVQLLMEVVFWDLAVYFPPFSDPTNDKWPPHQEPTAQWPGLQLPEVSAKLEDPTRSRWEDPQRSPLEHPWTNATSWRGHWKGRHKLHKTIAPFWGTNSLSTSVVNSALHERISRAQCLQFEYCKTLMRVSLLIDYILVFFSFQKKGNTVTHL